MARCKKCNRLLAVLLTRPWVIVCPRCHTENGYPDEGDPMAVK